MGLRTSGGERRFANATPITTAQGQATVDLGGATWEPGDPSGSSVWWKFAPGSSGRIRLRTCCAAGTSHIDSHTITLSLYRGSSLASLQLLGSNSGFQLPNVMSQVSFDATAGVTYYIAVGGEGSSATLYWEPGVAPPNSTADTAQSVPWTASGSAEENNSSEEGGSPLWWSTVAQSTGSARVFTASDGLGLEVYRRGGSGLLDLVAESNQYSGSPADVTFPAIAGTAYLFALRPGYDYTRSGTVALMWAFPTSSGGGSRVTTGLTSLYEFNETSGSTVNDTSGVGTPLNLTIANPANTAWIPGALRVNTATTISSAVAASKITSPSKASGGMTLEAWVKPANTTQTGPARIAAIATDTNTRNIEIAQSGTSYHGRLRGSAGGTITAFGTGADPTQLQHVVFVRDPNGTMSLYVNGTEVATATSPGDLSTWDSNMKLTLANVLGTTPRPWLGELHLVATYGRALTHSEITQNYTAGADPT